MTYMEIANELGVLERAVRICVKNEEISTLGRTLEAIREAQLIMYQLTLDAAQKEALKK